MSGLHELRQQKHNPEGQEMAEGSASRIITDWHSGRYCAQGLGAGSCKSPIWHGAWRVTARREGLRPAQAACAAWGWGKPAQAHYRSNTVSSQYIGGFGPAARKSA